MYAVTVDSFSAEDPLHGLGGGERPDPVAREGWVTVALRAAALNHHDVWSLRGVGTSPDGLPRVLGCDGAGTTADGREWVLHAVIGSADAGGGDETLDPGMSLFSERYDGTFAELVSVPERNLVPKPASLSWAEAACLPVAWLTAYRMIFAKAGVQPGDRILVQGAGGGVATAAIALGRAAGLRVYATSRDEAKRARALELGAAEVFEPGARLPERVDAVIETVGQATWGHSLKALAPGGTVVVSGTTSGPNPPADLTRVFARQIRVVGSTMGTRRQLEELVNFLDVSGVRPVIDSERPLSDAPAAFQKMVDGDLFGKLVLTA